MYNNYEMYLKYFKVIWNYVIQAIVEMSFATVAKFINNLIQWNNSSLSVFE